MRRLTVRIAQGGFLLALLIGSCNLQGQTPAPLPPSSASPSIAPSLLPDAPTPTPVVVRIGETNSALEQALNEWASKRGWGFVGIAEEAVSTGGPSLPEGARAVVSMAGLDVVSLTSGRDDLVAVVVDQEGSTPGPRVSTVGTPGARRDHAGFLAGVLAGSVGGVETLHVVSGTGGEWDGVYAGAFEHGVRYSCPRCTVIQVQAGDLASGGVGQQTGGLFVTPGPDATSKAGEAIALGVRWIVWVGERPDGIDDSHLAARVVFVRETLVVQALEALVIGEAGSAWPYTVDNGGIQFADVNQEAISPGRLRIAEEAYAQLASGELDSGVDPGTGAGP